MRVDFGRRFAFRHAEMCLKSGNYSLSWRRSSYRVSSSKQILPRIIGSLGIEAVGDNDFRVTLEIIFVE